MTNANPQPGDIFCTNCGEQQDANQTFCSNCGERLVNSHGQAINSRPISIPIPKPFEKQGFTRAATIVGLVAGIIAICGFIAGTTSLTGLLRGRVPHHGAFVRSFFGYKALLSTSVRYVRDSAGYGIYSEFPSISKNPTILLWEPEMNLSELGFYVYYPDGDDDYLSTEISSDGEYLYLTPSEKLISGYIYCYTAASPYLTVSQRPAWCFTVK